LNVLVGLRRRPLDGVDIKGSVTRG
jgi:hypothetical protein